MWSTVNAGHCAADGDRMLVPDSGNAHLKNYNKKFLPWGWGCSSSEFMMPWFHSHRQKSNRSGHYDLAPFKKINPHPIPAVPGTEPRGAP